MSLPDLERAFRAVGERLSHGGQVALKGMNAENQEIYGLTAAILGEMGTAFRLAADDLEDETRRRCGVEPLDRSKDNGNS